MVSHDERPITPTLHTLQGQSSTDDDLVAAGSRIAALPTVVVDVVLQESCTGGLTTGATGG